MILTGGIEAAEGKLYLLGTGEPTVAGCGGTLSAKGEPGGGAALATGGCFSAAGSGVPQAAAWRATYAS